jgi:Protein of unknown function DUF86
MGDDLTDLSDARRAGRATRTRADGVTLPPSCLTRFIEATPWIPWREVKGMRIIAAHAYHRIDYEEVWVTSRDDVPRLDQAIERWRQTQP